MNLKEIIGTEYSDMTNEKTESIPILNKEHFLLKCYREYANQMYDEYQLALSILKKVSYTKEDITSFSLLLPIIQDEINLDPAGFFLSALVNKHFKETRDSQEYQIVTENLKIPLRSLCIENAGAKVNIVGSAGDGLCRNMNSGEVTLKGNCRDIAGQNMKGGILILNHADRYLGCGMLDGKIYAKSAKGGLGINMEGGEIHISETCQERIGAFAGKVYLRDKLIFPTKKKKK